MSSGKSITELSTQLGDTVKRIEELQNNQAQGLNVRGHFRKQGGLLLNVTLAGCILAVAVGRLEQKAEYQVVPGDQHQP